MKLHHRKASLDGLGRLWRYAQHARPFAPLKKKVSPSSAPSMPSNMLLHLLNGRFWRFEGWTKNWNLILNQATYPLEINVAKKNHHLWFVDVFPCCLLKNQNFESAIRDIIHLGVHCLLFFNLADLKPSKSSSTSISRGAAERNLGYIPSPPPSLSGNSHFLVSFLTGSLVSTQ